MKAAITAAAVVSPLGNSLEDFRRSLFAGTPGYSGQRGSFPEDFPVSLLGRIELPTPPPFLLARKPTAGASSIVTCSLLEQIRSPLSRCDRIDAIVLGSRGPAFDELGLELCRKNRSLASVSGECGEELLDLAAEFLSEHAGVEVPGSRRYWISNACASGNALLGFALDKIRLGEWKRALLLNVDVDLELALLQSFHSLGALAIEGPEGPADRPFSRLRTGFVKAQAGVALLIERPEETAERNALGLIRGYANTNDAFRSTLGRPDARGLIDCIRSALDDAGISAEQIDYINAHATGTPQGDALEALAYQSVFGDHLSRIFVGALKGQMGHSTQSSGGVMALATMQALVDQRVPPVLGVSRSDLEFPIRIAFDRAVPAEMKFALNTNIGFGGFNSCVVFQRP